MRFLHVANGGCTTSVIEAAGIPGRRSVWCDPLYDGPVPGGLDDDALLKVRARFLAAPTEESYLQAVDGLRSWRATIEAVESYDELVLWYEHDLFDQLVLIQLLTWIRTRDVRARGASGARPVSLVCIGSFPGHPRFKGLGELAPDELASLLETRHPVGDDAYALAERAWQAFREPSPEPLDALRRSDTQAMPFLAAALERFLQEYPWTIDGLSRSERRLLRLAERGPIHVADAFPRMHDDEQAYYITDGSLSDLISALSRTSPPLVTIDREAGADGLLHGTVALTDAGREVLDGRRDRVACGLDRWFGGVHLQDGGGTWRWDDARGRMTYVATS